MSNEFNTLSAASATSAFYAKEEAVCTVCGGKIHVGDAITWNRKVAGEKWHLNCKDAGLRGERLAAIPASVAAPVVTDKMAALLVEIRNIVRDEIKAASAVETPSVATPKHEFIHQTRDEVLELVQLGLNVYLKGAAGSGKTHVAQQIADIMGLSLIPMQFDGFTAPILIKGYMDAQGKFSSTPVYEWLKSANGGILFVDEFDRGREDTLVCFNSLLANKYQMFANGEVLRMTDKHIIIAAGNTAMKGSDGVYTSARKQDASVLDRFVVIEWDYDVKLERALAASINAEYGVKWAKWVQAVRKYVADPSSGIKGGIICGMRVIMFGSTMLKLERYQRDMTLVVDRALAKGGVDAATIQRIIANVPLPQ
jgi:hypothetical protein